MNDNLRRKKRFTLTKGKIVALVSLMILGLVILWFLNTSSSSIFNFVLPGQSSLKSTDDRVNVLLLGLAGGNHDGALLTDSIIVASYNLKTHKVVLISIPRDLWLDGPKMKVNAVYENGGKGIEKLKFAEDKIDDVLGIPIHYGVRIDFAGFAKAVDLVGGIDVDVPRAFDDYEYPIEGKEDDLCSLNEQEVDLNQDQATALNLSTGKHKVLVDSTGKVATESADFACRFEHIHFNKGSTHMDGATALKYVRSRHALGPEGSDFARSKRQQLIIEAFREKALSLETLSNPQKIADLFGTSGQSIETDIPVANFLDFYKMTKNEEGAKSIVLGDLGDGKSLLINPPPQYGGGWVLTPPNNDFTQVKQYLKTVLDEQAGILLPTASPSASPRPK